MENKKRLVDANKLIDFIDVGRLRHPGELCYSEADVANILLHAPTIDAVPVVRCWECRHAVKIGKYGCYCRNNSTPWFNGEFEVYMDQDDFCSYGERKEGAN